MTRVAARLFVCGDVMTGRGVDQIMATPSQPDLYESYVRDARDYLRLAERRSGPVPLQVPPEYVWGDALEELARQAPHLRIVNLETSVTRSDRPWPGKGIHYRMHPGNVGCLTAAGLHCCVLGNNHVLDWGREGLLETLRTLERCGIATAGAGADATSARAPAVLALDHGRRLKVFAFGAASSGIPPDWAAAPGVPGVNLLPDLTPATAAATADGLRREKAAGDLLLASIHWGGNWGFAVSDEQREFARLLVERGGVDVVHGHSSHHPIGIEIYRGRPILYGCGDFLNDYEGIRGHEALRPDLALMYFIDLAADGALIALRMVPMQIRRLQLVRAQPDDAVWLASVLSRECRRFGAAVAPAGRELVVRW